MVATSGSQGWSCQLNEPQGTQTGASQGLRFIKGLGTMAMTVLKVNGAFISSASQKGWT